MRSRTANKKVIHQRHITADPCQAQPWNCSSQITGRQTTPTGIRGREAQLCKGPPWPCAVHAQTAALHRRPNEKQGVAARETVLQLLPKTCGVARGPFPGTTPAWAAGAPLGHRWGRPTEVTETERPQGPLPSSATSLTGDATTHKESPARPTTQFLRHFRHPN